MNIDFSKDFEKSVRKLSGKMLEAVRDVVKKSGTLKVSKTSPTARNLSVIETFTAFELATTGHSLLFT